MIRALEKELAALGTAERAEKEKGYLRSELRHLGCNMPNIRKTTKQHLAAQGELDHAALWKLVDGAWARPIHELRTAAVEMLCARPKLLLAKDIHRVEKLLRASKTWALVDPLAIAVAGGLVAQYRSADKRLDAWAKDDDFWIRRSSMLALLRPLRRGEGDFERFAGYAASMLHEKEFFIRKAIGWVLREVSKKRPKLVSDWLAPRLGDASGVTVREAVKYLPDGEDLLRRYKALRALRC